MEKTRKKMYGMAILLTVVFAAGAANAGMVDLTSYGTSGTINGATYTQYTWQPAGTGVIDPFVRIQANDSEQGYNSDGPYNGGPNALDEKSGIWTHDLQLGDVPIVDGYRQFLLDINEPNGDKALLSLDQLKIYLSPTPIAGKQYIGGTLVGGTLIYDMDAGGDSWVKLNYDLAAGSGVSDMYVDILSSLFGSDPTQYVYLYSMFGGQGGDLASGDGFEEWWVKKSDDGQIVPEPATMLLLGTGLAGLAGLKRRKKA